MFNNFNHPDNHYSNLFWISREVCCAADFEGELTVFGESYQGQKVRSCVYEKKGFVGVPVSWALRNGISGKDKTSFPKEKWPSRDFKPRHNQAEVIEKTVETLKDERSCLIEAPTSFGKTVTSLRIASEMGTRTLMVTHKIDLLNQWVASAKEFCGLKKVGKIQGQTVDYDHKFVVATAQSLTSKMDTLPSSFWKNFGFVIFDESHRFASDTFVDIAAKLSCRYSLGVSATLRRTDGMEALWEHHLGKIAAKGKFSEKRERYLQSPVVDCGLRDNDFYDYRGEIAHTKCITKIAESAVYNYHIVQFVNQVVGMGRTPVVLTHRKSQLEILEDLLEEEGYESIGIYAGGKHRGKTIKPKDLEQASGKDILLATYNKIGEGVDLDKKYDTVILATPTTDSQQSIGRVSRSKDSKPALIIHPIIYGSNYAHALYNKCHKKVYTPLKVKEV